MPRTFYTIDDLIMFCKQNNFSRFNAKENDGPLVIQSIETFETSDSSKNGLLPVLLKSCHIGVNRNRSAISQDVMEANMASFKGRPILGSIIKTDTDEYEFHSHDMTYDEDGEVEYIEQPVGVISELEEPHLEYDKDEDKTYLMVSGHIFEDYSHAAEILQRRKTCKCSVEIAINEMSWNCDDDCLSIDDFYFLGVTILGYEQDGVTEIQEGMKGSKITIDNFSAEQNSMFNINYSDKIVDLLSNIEKKLDNLSYIESNQKGVEEENMSHFEELLLKYNKTVEDIDFEYEEMEDEELDAKFEELFSEVEETEEENNDDDEGEGEEETVTEEEAKKKKKKCSVDENENMTVEFEVSHDDIRWALYNLIGQYDDADDEYYYIMSVYDDYFFMRGWCNNKIYKQSYTVDNDNVALSGERQEMFELIVTESEKLAIEEMRSNYEALKEFKENYDAEVLKAEKEAVFNSPEYADICESEKFEALVNKADQYSVEELKVKCDLLFAAYVKENGSFAINEVKDNKKHSVSINLNTKSGTKKPYGKLFND